MFTKPGTKKRQKKKVGKKKKKKTPLHRNTCIHMHVHKGIRKFIKVVVLVARKWK